VSRTDDLERVFSALTAARAEALIVIPSAIAFASPTQVADLALKYRLPSVFASRDYVEAGGLMSYGPSIVELWRRAATYVDKILKGAKAG